MRPAPQSLVEDSAGMLVPSEHLMACNLLLGEMARRRRTLAWCGAVMETKLLREIEALARSLAVLRGDDAKG